jgi:predicted alpha/beta-fold hydrolase
MIDYILCYSTSFFLGIALGAGMVLYYLSKEQQDDRKI